VVVDLDLSCAASDEWYLSNQTQPRRDQPWYHLLVDSAVHTTYAAEENLEPDPDGGQITHPLLGMYFLAYDGGSYVRNERPWGSA
jgi:heat shock protein HspQ